MKITKGVDLASKNFTHPDDIDGFPKRGTDVDGWSLVRMILNPRFSVYSKHKKVDGLAVLGGYVAKSRSTGVKSDFTELTEVLKFINK